MSACSSSTSVLQENMLYNIINTISVATISVHTTEAPIVDHVMNFKLLGIIYSCKCLQDAYLVLSYNITYCSTMNDYLTTVHYYLSTHAGAIIRRGSSSKLAYIPSHI